MKLTLTLAFLISTVILCINAQQNATVIYEWNEPTFSWDSDAELQQYLNSSRYIPANVIPAGIKLWKNTIFLTIPRLLPGIPATLVKLIEQNGTATLEPFPSLAIQNLNDTLNGINNVQSIEIDPTGRMWILDSGRYNTLAGTVVNAPARLFVYDLNANQFIRNFTFPNSVAPSTASNLHDMVLDQDALNLYIVNMFGSGSIVVYSWNNNSAYLFQTPSMAADNSAGSLNISNTTYNFNSPIDGIALSRDGRTLFYSPLTSTHLYSIDTMYLRNTSFTAAQRTAAVIDWGVKGFSDGMTFSNNGKLYFGDLANNAIKSWTFGDSNGTFGNVSDVRSLYPNISSASVVASDSRIEWPDTFGWDNSGYLWFVTNKLNVALSGGDYSSNVTNFRIWKVYVNGGSYLQARTSSSSSHSGSSDSSNIFDSDSNENNGQSSGPNASPYSGDSLYQSISGGSALSSWLF